MGFNKDSLDLLHELGYKLEWFEPLPWEVCDYEHDVVRNAFGAEMENGTTAYVFRKFDSDDIWYLEFMDGITPFNFPLVPISADRSRQLIQAVLNRSKLSFRVNTLIDAILGVME